VCVCVVHVCTAGGSAASGSAEKGGGGGGASTDDEVNVMMTTQTGPIQACCAFLLHSLSWLIIIVTFPFSVCLCLKVLLASTTRHCMWSNATRHLFYF